MFTRIVIQIVARKETPQLSSFSQLNKIISAMLTGKKCRQIERPKTFIFNGNFFADENDI